MMRGGEEKIAVVGSVRVRMRRAVVVMLDEGGL
jgi:hypothetical protein